MKRLSSGVILAALAGLALGQSPDPPLADSRLEVNTLVREDIFAGFLAGDMERFARGERSIHILLQQRPGEKATLLAWDGAAKLYRSVRAFENNERDEFERFYRQARDSFSLAEQLSAGNPSVDAIIGGSCALMADRLPKEQRGSAWSQAYNSYKALWKAQAPTVEKLPVHLRGELLGGLAQSAQKTGHTEEFSQSLDKIIAVMRDTPYEQAARKWKENPGAAVNVSLSCLSCHDAGRLGARMASLKSQ